MPSFSLSSLPAPVKSIVKLVCDAYVFPFIATLETKLPVGAVQTIVTEITASLEKEIDAELA